MFAEQDFSSAFIFCIIAIKVFVQNKSCAVCIMFLVRLAALAHKASFPMQAASGRAFDFLDYLPTPACVDDADDFRRAVELWSAALEKGALGKSGVSGVTLTTSRLHAHAVAVLSQRGDLGQVVQLLGIKSASSIGLRKKAPPRAALYNPLLWGARHYHAPAIAMETLQAARNRGAFLPTDTWNMILGAVCPCGRPEDIIAVLLAMETSGTPGNLETIKHMTTARSVLVLSADTKPQRAKSIADARATLLRLLTLWAPAFTDMDAGAAASSHLRREAFSRERIRGAGASTGSDSPVSGDRKSSLSARPRMSATTREVVRAAGGPGLALPAARHHSSASASTTNSGPDALVETSTAPSGSLGLTINLDSGMTAQALADALVSSLASVQQHRSAEHADTTSSPHYEHAHGASFSHGSQFVSLSGLGGLGSSTSSGLGLGGSTSLWGDTLGLAGDSTGWSPLADDSASQQLGRNPEQDASETAVATAAAVWGGDAGWGPAPTEAVFQREQAHQPVAQGPFNPASTPWAEVQPSRQPSMGSAVSAGSGSGSANGSGVDPAILQRAQLALEALMQQEHGGHGGSLASGTTASDNSVAAGQPWGAPPSGYASSGGSHLHSGTPGSSTISTGGVNDPMQVLHELRAALANVGGPSHAYHPPQPHMHGQHAGHHPSSQQGPGYGTPYLQGQSMPQAAMYGTSHVPGIDGRPVYSPPQGMQAPPPHPNPAHYSTPTRTYANEPGGVVAGASAPFPPAHPAAPGGAAGSTGQWDAARSDVSRGSRGSRGSGSGAPRSKPPSQGGSVGPRDRQVTRGSVLSASSRASKSSNANDSAVSGRSGSSRGSGHNSPRKLSRKQIGLLPTPPGAQVAPGMMPGGTNPMLTPARLAPTYGRHHHAPTPQTAAAGYHQAVRAPPQRAGYDPPSSYHVTPPGRASIHSVMSSEHSSDRTVRTGSTSTSRASFSAPITGHGGGHMMSGPQGYPLHQMQHHQQQYGAGGHSLYTAGTQHPGHY